MLTLRFYTPSRVTIVLNAYINSTFRDISALLASKFNIDSKFIEIQYNFVTVNEKTMIKNIPYFDGGSFLIKFTRPLATIFNFDSSYTIPTDELIKKLPYLLTINQNRIDCLTALYFTKASLYASIEILLDKSINLIKTFDGSDINKTIVSLANKIPKYISTPKEKIQPAIYDIGEIHKFLNHNQPTQSSNKIEPEENNLVTHVSIPRLQDNQKQNDDQSTDDCSNDVEDDCQEEKTIDINSSQPQEKPEKTQEANEPQKSEVESNQPTNFDVDMWQQYLNNIKDDLFFDTQSVVMGQVDTDHVYAEKSINEQIQAYESTSTDSEQPKATPPSPKAKTPKKKQKADIQPLPDDVTVYKVNIRVKEALLDDEFL